MPLDRKLAQYLNRFPVFKSAIKQVYFRFWYLFKRKGYKYLCDHRLETFRGFFGYYDKKPQNGRGLVLAHMAEFETNAPPSAEVPIKIAVFAPGEKQEPIFTVESSAYNWQQGARAHWLDDDLFIFNDFDTVRHQYCARVFSVSSQDEERRFDMPVQASCAQGYYLSLNYQRLMSLRPDYGYRNLSALSRAALQRTDGDGIWRVDYETGESRLLISFSQMCEVGSRLEFDSAIHKANHVMISPLGNQFIFLHRYYIGQRRLDRLILADSQTGEMRLLADYRMVSHCFWVDSNTVLGYMRGPGNKDGYWLLDVETGEFKPCLQDKLAGYGDGHPHVYGDWFVTDTYPDKARMQHLLLCNWKTGEVKELGEFFHGFDYVGETRCDLHPRFSPDGKAVFFDSVFTGQRQLYRMELPE